MKSALTVVLFLLFTIGVFADGNEVSVTEGDSVTLKSGFTERQTDEGIEWRFSGTRIAKISSDSNEIWVKPDGTFKDRLKLDSQTGDLKISNIRTTDSGQYRLKISSPRGSSEMTFTVTVVPVDEVKSVSVPVGDSVPLQTGLNYIQRDAVIQWRFDQNSLVAKINRTAGIFKIYDDVLDGEFKGRLELNKQTGSLTINNTRTTDSGEYEADIISTSSRYTIHKTFTVTVSADVKSVSVMEGKNVTLRTSLPGTQIIKWILWKFGDDGELVADLNGTYKKWTNTDLNNQTGDLTIRNVQRDQCGDYKVEINTRTKILLKKYNITIIAVPDSGVSPAAGAGIGVVAVILVAAAVAVVI